MSNLFLKPKSFLLRASSLFLKVVSCFPVIICLFVGQASHAETSKTYSQLPLGPADRILILAPHPDDDILGCAGIIQRAVEMRIPVRVVFLTNGDSNQWSFMLYTKKPVLGSKTVRRMGQVRQEEALRAAALLGLGREDLLFLGYPDFGTIAIWYRHWGRRPPYTGLFTRAKAVPYAEARRPGAPYKGEEILRDLKDILLDFKPTKVFVSHAADQNGDHRALFLFSTVALWDLEQTIQPEVYPYLIHFRRGHWPKPNGFHPQADLKPPDELRGEIAWKTFVLTGPETQLKMRALRRHETQFGYSAPYLSSFARTNELFGGFQPVRFGSNMPPTLIEKGETKDFDEILRSLTEEERADFVGLKWSSAEKAGPNLILSMEYSRPLSPETSVSFYVFGYRQDKSFSEMPKYYIRVSHLHHAVFDQGRSAIVEGLKVRRDRRKITLTIPIESLGGAERILVGGRSNRKNLPLDWVAWREILLK